MNLDLKSDDEALRKKFIQLKTVDDICDLLEIDKKTLIYYLYRKKGHANYKVFSIKKRSGGTRTISAPVSSLKIIQRKLSHILNLIYEIRPRVSAHGYRSNRNIVSNAVIHSGKTLLLNIDLKDFFPSINFGRVRGLFISSPFSLSPEIATVLAQICILDNGLPQGAPTSPVISNFISSRLDGQLQRLAKENKLLYTRYADDITFSNWRNSFPNNIVKEKYNALIIGSDLEKIIESNGFTVNEKKTRISSSYQRQVITGLVVNKFPNIKRDYVREIRVILNNWRKYGIDKARDEYYAKRGEIDRSPHKPASDFKLTILGKINFVKMVKGYRNSVYRGLMNQYNFISKNHYPFLPVDEDKKLGEYVWIIEVNGKSVGTGFLLEGYGLITCAHVINGGSQILAYRPTNPNKKYSLQATKVKFFIDFAILDFQEKNIDKSFFYLKKNSLPAKVRDLLLVIGFPLLYSDKKPFFYETKIVSIEEVASISRFVLDSKPLTRGMSGSPLLNNKNEVVAILSNGASNLEEASDVIAYTAVPISYLDDLV